MSKLLGFLRFSVELHAEISNFGLGTHLPSLHEEPWQGYHTKFGTLYLVRLKERLPCPERNNATIQHYRLSSNTHSQQDKVRSSMCVVGRLGMVSTRGLKHHLFNVMMATTFMQLHLALFATEKGQQCFLTHMKVRFSIE